MNKTGKLEVKISVTDTDKVEALIHLLAKYQDDLPSELVKSLKVIADCGSCEIGFDELKNRGINHFDVSVFSNKAKLDDVVSVNPILKRITHASPKGEYYSYPNDAKMENLDKIICEWG